MKEENQATDTKVSIEDNFILDFVGVGSAKAGTTWVARILEEHPKTCIGKGKELMYFVEKQLPFMQKMTGEGDKKAAKSKDQIIPGTLRKAAEIEKDLNWLKAQFTHREPGQLLGEITPNYLNDPSTPRLISEHNPNAKILFNFRNPVDALYSMYYHFNRFLPVPGTFDDALEKMPEMKEYFHFGEHVEKYLAYFPKEQMHFIFMDDVKADNNKVYEELCEFLGVEPVENSMVNARVNPSKAVQSKFLRNTVYGVSVLLGRGDKVRNLRDKLKKGIVGKAWNKVKKANLKTETYDKMNPETRKELIEYYQPFNKKLSSITGRDLSNWDS